MRRHFVSHRPHHPVDPAFLREERRFLDHEYAALHVMERHRDQLVRDIETAKRLARKAGIELKPPSEEREQRRLTVIGVGNRFLHDDAAGPEVARRLREAQPAGVKVLEEEGEPTSLLEAWTGADEALLIDGVNSGAAAGTLHRFEVSKDPLPIDMFRPSTHALGVADAVELARELDRLPGRLAVYGIEGERFDAGEGLTPAVDATVQVLVAELHAELGG
jgi:hydrogenase maturation protease